MKNGLIKIFATVLISTSIFGCGTTDDLMYSFPETSVYQDTQLGNYSISAIEQKNLNILEGMMTGKIQSDTPVINSDLFPQGENAISISDVQQGERPICYYLSALGGLAYHRPEDIKKLVVDNLNGTYTVTFPGLPKSKNKVTVDRPSEGDLGFYIHKGSNGAVWPAVMAKAIAKYWSNNGIFRFFRSDSDAANWGGSWESIEIITGHKTDFMLIAVNTNDRILSKLNTALMSKKIASSSTIGKGNLNPKNKSELFLSKAHVLAILKVDLNQKTITLRDPYGANKYLDENGNIYKDRSTDGIITLPVSEFRKYFTDISIETGDPVNFLSSWKYLK